MTLPPRFWRRHAIWPALAFLLVAAGFAATDLDEVVTRAWAFDAGTGHFIGSGAGAWWARDLIHTAGGRAVRVLGGGVVLLWAATFVHMRLRRWRRPAGYVVLSVALGAGLVGVLKQITNVDCPWSLAAFGGDWPHVGLFADRPDHYPRAQCFPGGHSSSGFALFALYFLMLGRKTVLARLALAAALLVGAAFAVGQEARGAHFLSHDLWSAAIVWFSCLTVYTAGYRGQVWDAGVIPDTAAPKSGMSPIQRAIHS